MVNPTPSVSWRRAAKFGATIVLFALAVFLLPLFRNIIIIFVFSLLLAYVLEPVVSTLESRGVERLWAIALLFLLFAGIVALAIKFLFPAIVNEINSIRASLQIRESFTTIGNVKDFLRRQLAFLGDQQTIENLTDKVQSLVSAIIERFFLTVLRIFSTLSNLVIVPLITFFLLKDGRRMKKALIRFVPNRYFEMSLNLLHKVDQQLGNYIRGQLLDAFIVGILSIIALYYLDVRYFLIIGAVAGLANLIPYFGPIVGAIPAIIVALMDTGSLTPVIGIAVAFAAIQLLDNALICPLVVAKSVHLHPLTVIIVIIIGGHAWGLLGMLLAVPVASIIKVTAQELSWSFKNYRLV